MVGDAFAEHHAFVRDRLRWLGVPTADLDDATQDVFVVLTRRICEYDPVRGSVAGLLTGIARRVAVRYRRDRRVIPLPERECPTHEAGPEEFAALREAERVLEDFLGRLDPDRWSVFVLSELEGLRGSEIAVELGVNQNTIYARLRSARTELERTLARHRARQRRGWRSSVAAWFIPPRRTPAALAGGLGALALVGGAAMLLVFGDASCVEASSSPDDASRGAEAGPSATERRTTEARTAAPGPGWEGLTRPSPEPMPWIDGGSGTTSTETWALDKELRYRFDGDRVEFEVLYAAHDAPVEAFGSHLVLEGLRVAEGTDEWSVSLDADASTTVRFALQPTREGTVSANIVTGYRAPEFEDRSVSGQHAFTFVNDRGTLRACSGVECDAPFDPDAHPPSGRTIDVRVVSECDETVELALFPGPRDRLPPRDTPTRTLRPRSSMPLTLDADDTIRVRKSGGTFAHGSLTPGNGAVVTFRGPDCEVMSSRSQSR